MQKFLAVVGVLGLALGLAFNSYAARISLTEGPSRTS